MKAYLVATITCPDQPGIVEQITKVLVEHSANWEESRMARLGGDFAGIIRIGVPVDQAEVLAERLRALGDDRRTVTVKRTGGDESASREGQLLRLRLTGADHEGIVHTVSAYLASRGINVETMETEVTHAPVTASPLFHMSADIKVPFGLPRGELQEHLHRIGAELGVDIEIQSD
jgi:glycine cleavage system regulatory protein